MGGDNKAWAAHALRPDSPTGSSKEDKVDKERPQIPLHGQRREIDAGLWQEKNFITGAVVKPWVSEIGWKVANRITEQHWEKWGEGTSPKGNFVPPPLSVSLSGWHPPTTAVGAKGATEAPTFDHGRPRAPSVPEKTKDAATLRPPVSPKPLQNIRDKAQS